MNKSAVANVMSHFLPDKYLANPEALTPYILLDPTKTYVKFSAFIADTDQDKMFADALDRGCYWFDPEERAYVIGPDFLTCADKYNFSDKGNDTGTPDFYLNNGFVSIPHVLGAIDAVLGK